MTELPPGAGPVDRIVPGTKLREWRVDRFIARGAYGQVFEARRSSWVQDEPSRALKVFDPILSSAARSALVAEFDVLRSSRHPHLLRGEDAFDIEDGPFAGCVVFVLERAESDLATEIARHGPRPAAIVAAIGAQVADGLAALHADGHLHGDVKPENVLRVDDVWKLGDFGVASTLEGSYALASATTLDYRPPELSAAEAGVRVHRAADVWALGVTLWVAATGQHPFVGADPQLRYAAVLRDDRLPATVDPRLAHVLEQRCFARSVRERVDAAELAREMAALATALAGAASGVPAAPPTTSPGPARTSAADAGSPGATSRSTMPTPTPTPTPTVPLGSPTVEAPSGGAAALVEAPTGTAAAHKAASAPAPGIGALVGAAALGVVVTAIVVEACSWLAAALPGGLVVRRAAYLVMTVVAMATLAVVARPRTPSTRWLVVAVLAAVVTVAVATTVLFGAFR